MENNNNFNIPFEQAYTQNDKEKEYLVLNENSSVLTGKKSSIIGKFSGSLIALVCLVEIVLCIIEGGINISIKNNDNKLTLKQLGSSDNLYENENDTLTNIIIKDEDININKNVPLPIQQSSFENNQNRL